MLDAKRRRKIPKKPAGALATRGEVAAGGVVAAKIPKKHAGAPATRRKREEEVAGQGQHGVEGAQRGSREMEEAPCVRTHLRALIAGNKDLV